MESGALMGDPRLPAVDELVGTENEQTYDLIVLDPARSDADLDAALVYAALLPRSEAAKAQGIRDRWT